MNFVFSIVVALSTPAFAADIDPPIPEPAPLEITVTEPDPVIEEDQKPVDPDPPKVTSSACNCYNLLLEEFGSVPSMATLESMATATASVGDVAFMRYPATPAWPAGIPHVAIVRSIAPDGSLLIEEYNFQSCTHSHRTISPYYYRLIGFITLPSPTAIGMAK